MIPVQEGDLVEPVRQNGRVVAVKVTPPGGKPYYLIDSTGTGALLGAQRETERLGCRFVLRRPSGRILATLDHMGVRKVFSIEP